MIQALITCSLSLPAELEVLAVTKDRVHELGASLGIFLGGLELFA